MKSATEFCIPKFIKVFSINSIADWKKFIKYVNGVKYSGMEWQADAFAGLVLVPTEILRGYFSKELLNFLPQIRRVQSRGIPRHVYLDYFIDVISDILAKRFNVSRKTVTIRVERESLQSEVP